MTPVEAGSFYIEITVGELVYGPKPVEIVEFTTPRAAIERLDGVYPLNHMPIAAVQQGSCGMCAVIIHPEAKVTRATMTIPSFSGDKTVEIGNGREAIRISRGSIRVEGTAPWGKPFIAEVY